ncbi:MAG TPA: hypothetical protein VE714_00885, partial [Gemmatimonadales bacterium]|nr:hypothetical protein [Gemmatimonadales bacterium]
RAQWTRFEKPGADLAARALVAETQSTSGGRYALCELPPDTRIVLSARRGRAPSDSIVLRLEPGEVRRVDLGLRAR